MPKLSIRDLDLKGKRLFMRVDFNVPLTDDGQQITSDKRIKASLPSIQYALEKGAGLVLASHLGRPKGKPNPAMSMKPVGARLAEVLGRPVAVAPDCIGAEVEKMLPKPGEVLLLENLRFHAEEEKNNPEFSQQLAKLGDVYVNDAFGSAHRAHASTEGITHHLQPCAAGLLMDKELEYLTKATAHPEHPCVAILGGAKVSDKIEVIENLLKFADQLIIGGAMAYTFMAAQGKPTGKSLVEADKIDLAKDILGKAQAAGVKLLLPVDNVIADKFEATAATEVAGENIKDGWMALDIGPKSARIFADEVRKSKTVVWNGPMGCFEMKPFAAGTLAIARALAETKCLSIVGGGDSVSAVNKSGLADKITHISTGGGASLEFLEGKQLPGVVALTDKNG
jgi:phosphoglycerate kinase